MKMGVEAMQDSYFFALNKLQRFSEDTCKPNSMTFTTQSATAITIRVRYVTASFLVHKSFRLFRYGAVPVEREFLEQI